MNLNRVAVLDGSLHGGDGLLCTESFIFTISSDDSIF